MNLLTVCMAFASSGLAPSLSGEELVGEYCLELSGRSRMNLELREDESFELSFHGCTGFSVQPSGRWSLEGRAVYLPLVDSIHDIFLRGLHAGGDGKAASLASALGSEFQRVKLCESCARDDDHRDGICFACGHRMRTGLAQEAEEARGQLKLILEAHRASLELRKLGAEAGSIESLFADGPLVLPSDS